MQPRRFFKFYALMLSMKPGSVLMLSMASGSVLSIRRRWMLNSLDEGVERDRISDLVSGVWCLVIALSGSSIYMPVHTKAKDRLQSHTPITATFTCTSCVLSLPLSFRRTPQTLHLNLIGQGWVSYFSSSFHFPFIYVVDNKLHHVFSSSSSSSTSSHRLLATRSTAEKK